MASCPKRFCADFPSGTLSASRFARGPEGTLRPAPGNGAADTPLPDADAAFSRPFGVGGGCCVLAPLLSQLFAISSSRFTFHWPFARLALVRPGLRRFSGRPLRPSGRKPGGLDGRNGLPIPRRSFGTPSNRFSSR
ncbi:hypothetical protein RLV_3299 [Rhizobium leguminosarum bv. viciae]|nr:hypothetical protein RLV_3299 [Rhizobium leguminosarum bv. viciae]